jgi:hypothetical protein
MDERQHPDREARPKVAVVSAEQAESFAILRRPQVDSDRLPESRWKVFDGGLIGRCGLNPALARRGVTQVGDVWVVPGSGYIGLDVGGMGCDRTEVAASRGMVTWTSLRSGFQDLVHGLVPDGVEEVTLLAANTASTTVFVNENVYGAVLDGHFRSGSFSGLTGTVEFGPAVARHGLVHVSLPDAQQRAPFTVLIPERIPAGWHSRCVLIEPSQRPPSPVQILLNYHSDDGHESVSLSQYAAADKPSHYDLMIRNYGWRTIDHNGAAVQVRTPGPQAQAYIERDRTFVFLTSETLSGDQLATIAAGLKPAPSRTSI